MPIEVIDIGQPHRIAVVFKNSGGTAVDPTTVTFVFRKPSDSVTTYVYGTDSQLVKDSVGNYHVDLTPAAGEHGEWQYRWTSTRTPAQAEPGEFAVRPRQEAAS